ncbi:hypothetical protein QE152_g9747 [Popillia japonica]|uniref:Uncharacterized protein n=1 Tax=Popillia japonica TaxID=7064 RepID=A0AAW1LXS3_POPJA
MFADNFKHTLQPSRLGSGLDHDCDPRSRGSVVRTRRYETADIRRCSLLLGARRSVTGRRSTRAGWISNGSTGYVSDELKEVNQELDGLVMALPVTLVMN